VTPFAYLSDRHERRFSPGPFATYQDYKPTLRLEFHRKCVYCRLPDGMKGYEAFGVDHYKPKRRFPAHRTRYENLFYCCNVCNTNKGEFWPTKAELLAGCFVPNPCDHRMFDHVRFKNLKVEGRSTAGRHLVELLDLNDPQKCEYRELISGTITLTSRRREEVLWLTGELAKQRAAASDEERDRMDETLAELAVELAKLETHLDRLTGRAG
jgi:hypothetical protein